MQCVQLVLLKHDILVTRNHCTYKSTRLKTPGFVLGSTPQNFTNRGHFNKKAGT